MVHARSNHGDQSHELFLFFRPMGKETRLKQVIIVYTFEHVIAIALVYLKLNIVEKLHYLCEQCINFTKI
jgi:hypothetical protein